MSTFGCDPCASAPTPVVTYSIGDVRPAGVYVTPDDEGYVGSATYMIVNDLDAVVGSGSCTVSVAPAPGDPMGGPYTAPPTSTVKSSGLITWNALGTFLVRYTLVWSDSVVDNSLSQEIEVVPLAQLPFDGRSTAINALGASLRIH